MSCRWGTAGACWPGSASASRKAGTRCLPNASWMRYPRSMAHLHKAVRLADLAFVYDAAEVERGGHVLVVLCEKEQTPCW